eukprot:gene19104-biopygen16025
MPAPRPHHARHSYQIVACSPRHARASVLFPQRRLGSGGGGERRRRAAGSGGGRLVWFGQVWVGLVWSGLISSGNILTEHHLLTPHSSPSGAVAFALLLWSLRRRIFTFLFAAPAAPQSIIFTFPHICPGAAPSGEVAWGGCPFQTIAAPTVSRGSLQTDGAQLDDTGNKRGSIRSSNQGIPMCQRTLHEGAIVWTCVGVTNVDNSISNQPSPIPQCSQPLRGRTKIPFAKGTKRTKTTLRAEYPAKSNKGGWGG